MVWFKYSTGVSDWLHCSDSRCNRFWIHPYRCATTVNRRKVIHLTYQLYFSPCPLIQRWWKSWMATCLSQKAQPRRLVLLPRRQQCLCCTPQTCIFSDRRSVVIAAIRSAETLYAWIHWLEWRSDPCLRRLFYIYSMSLPLPSLGHIKMKPSATSPFLSN